MLQVQRIIAEAQELRLSYAHFVRQSPDPVFGAFEFDVVPYWSLVNSDVNLVERKLPAVFLISEADTHPDPLEDLEHRRSILHPGL